MELTTNRTPTSQNTILFSPLGFNLAEVTRMIEVARATAQLGMTPVFQIHDSGYDCLVDDAGFQRLPGAQPLTTSQAQKAIAFDQGRSFSHPFTETVVRERVVKERQAISFLGARAVVHGTNPTSPISARAEQVPLIYPVPYIYSQAQLVRRQTIPFVPYRGVGPHINRLLQGPAVKALNSPWLMPKSFRTIAQENGIRLRGLLDLLHADYTLLTCMPDEFEGAPLPAGTVRVGPIFAHLDAELPDQVLELAAQDAPLVYCAFGSSGTASLTWRALGALGNAPVNVIAPVKQYLSQEQISRLPKNVHVTDLLPAHRLGELVDAAVLHGGQGTVQTACATGVPFVGVGLSAEQRWNVDVWVRRGNAVSLTAGDFRGRALRFHKSLRHILTDASVRATARYVAQEHKDEDGARESAKVIAQVTGNVRAQRGIRHWVN